MIVAAALNSVRATKASIAKVLCMGNFLHNVKAHATLSARAHVDHGVGVEVTKEHVNSVADRGCVSRLVLHLNYSSVAWKHYC
jgi:hypothetical protein